MNNPPPEHNLGAPVDSLLTPEECLQIDHSLLPTRDRFAIRVAVYALRCLTAIATSRGQTIATLEPEQIAEHIRQQPVIQEQTDAEFNEWYGSILRSSLRPLREIAQESQVEIEVLNMAQIIGWFERAVKARSANKDQEPSADK